MLSLLWNADNSRSFCPSFRSWRISPTAPHISNVSDLPYAASPFYCAAFFVKEQGAVLRYGTEKGEAFQYRVALLSPKCEDWYNRKRIHGAIGYMTPQQKEDEELKKAA